MLRPPFVLARKWQPKRIHGSLPLSGASRQRRSRPDHLGGGELFEEKPAQDLGRGLVALLESVGIDAECRRGVRVPQPAGHRPDVHAGPDQLSSEGYLYLI